MEPLSPAEVAACAARGIPLEARCVPTAELARAIAEDRVQYASSSSSMGTAETSWADADTTTPPDALREDGIVIPPGGRRQTPGFADSYDDRDVIGRLWVWFWREQTAALVHAVPAVHRDAVLEECARMLVALERRFDPEYRVADRAVLVDWLIAADRMEPSELATALAARTRSSTRHLVTGIRARWLTRDVEAAIGAVLASARRFDRARHGDRAEQRAARMALLRFVLALP